MSYNLQAIKILSIYFVVVWITEPEDKWPLFLLPRLLQVYCITHKIDSVTHVCSMHKARQLNFINSWMYDCLCPIDKILEKEIRVKRSVINFGRKEVKLQWISFIMKIKILPPFKTTVVSDASLFTFFIIAMNKFCYEICMSTVTFE